MLGPNKPQDGQNKMKTIQYLFLLALASVALCGTQTLRAADIDPKIAEITKTAEAFVDAFHKGDAKAVAAFWMPDGDYVDEHGRILKGRKAIEDAYAEVFANNKGLKLRIDVASIRFAGPDVALEDGTSAVLWGSGNAPKRARYNNVLLKKDGKWLLASVREAAYTDPTNYEFLRKLDWVIGEWMDDVTNGPSGHITFEWGPGQNFIMSTRTMEYSDASLDNGMQMIGWDPATKQIHSWSFEADGGHGESAWSKDGSKWVVKTKATLADGSAVTATNIITPVDDDTIKWQSKERTAGGKPVSDSKEVTMKRVGDSTPSRTYLSSSQTNNH
jgi:uncharacterized protein (TIGR02246 family)